MIETMLIGKAFEIVQKVKTFFNEMGLEFYEIKEENQGKSKYIKISVSIKIS